MRIYASHPMREATERTPTTLCPIQYAKGHRAREALSGCTFEVRAYRCIGSAAGLALSACVPMTEEGTAAELSFDVNKILNAITLACSRSAENGGRLSSQVSSTQVTDTHTKGIFRSPRQVSPPEDTLRAVTFKSQSLAFPTVLTRQHCARNCKRAPRDDVSGAESRRILGRRV